MTKLRRPVIKNHALGYWQVSALEQQPYDVADAPMQGEMDPFFFVTEKKNYIPHTYPCRIEFQKEFANKQVEPVIEPEYVDWVVPFGADRLDRSGFLFRPTRLASWAKTQLCSEESGEAVFQFGTCGGAVLYLNGKKIFCCSEYQRNHEETHDITLQLNAGSNLVEIYFDDLAERDCLYYIKFTQISGQDLYTEIDIPVPAGLVDTLENMLNDLAFDKSAYFYSPGEKCEVALKFAKTANIPLEVTTTVSGDFMSTENPFVFHNTLEPGQSKVVVANASDLPSDFRHFTIQLSASYEGNSFSLNRTLGVEIGTSIDTLDEKPEQRANKVLQHIAEQGEKDAVWAIAMFALGRQNEEVDRVIESLLPLVQRCDDCADFILTPLLYLRIRWPELVNSTLKSRLDKTILDFRYWMDEPGNDVQWYFSENHSLLFHTCAYLAGSLLDDQTFTRSKRTGREQSQVGHDRLVDWFDHFEASEMAEWNSSPYFPIDLKGLTALYALAHHDNIRERAAKAIIRLLKLFAHSSHLGIMTASQGRSYEHSLRAGQTLELSGFSLVLWNRGGLGSRYHALPQFILCMLEHGLSIPQSLKDIAHPSSNNYHEWYMAQGENCFARLYHYKSSDFAMGSCVDYRQGEWGYQENALHLRIGNNPRAQVWVNHPGEDVICGYGRPSYWGGCRTIPAVYQYRSTAVMDFNVDKSHLQFSHAWFPVDEFDEVHISNNLIAARSHNAYVVLLGSKDLVLHDKGPTKNMEVRQYGQRTQWLIKVGTLDTPTLQPLIKKFAEATFTFLADKTLQLTDPEYGPVSFTDKGVIQAEGRTLTPSEWKIQGTYNTFTSPCHTQAIAVEV